MKKILLVLFLFMFKLILSWGITVGLTYLITLCFNLHFTILNGTGVWLTLVMIKLGLNVKE